MTTTPHTILIVEDNDFVRMQLVRFVEEGGYTAVEATDGGAALDAMRAQPISAVVLDVRMEPMDGFEMIKTMQSRNMVLPVILVTGDQNPDLLAEASRSNVSAVLMKPVQKDRLLNMLSRAVQPKVKR